MGALSILSLDQQKHIASAMNLIKLLQLPRLTGLALLITFSAWNSYLLFGQEQQAEADTPRPKSLITFFAMGDIPYNDEQDLLLIQQIEQLPRQAEFCVHVGDIKTQGTPCDELVFNKVFGMLRQSPLPMFIVPGDNEWNDCDNPIQAWSYWAKYFLRFDQRWHHRLRVFRQLEREENFSFVRNHVLFVGLNLVGGLVHDEAEWKLRLEQNLVWTKRNLDRFDDEIGSAVIIGHCQPAKQHEPYFHGLVEKAAEFAKPILYLHGDGHVWIHDRPFTAKNILRVQVDSGEKAPPVKVSVSDSATDPFTFDRGEPYKH